MPQLPKQSGRGLDTTSHPSGLYIHIPFCLTKCPYCDFYSITDLSLTDTFLDALEGEAHLYADWFDTYDSLYIGGGTPSVLEPRQIERLFSILRSSFAFEEDTEVTTELNPDDVTYEKLDALRRAGVNRLSIGVQSFDDGELAFLGRRHGAAVSRHALAMARDAAFGNVGIDLIYGLPGQTPDGWQATLEEAMTFVPRHLSCYQLTIEETTPFGRLKRDGVYRPVGEERERELFLRTSGFLEDRDFIHYEVSNFALSEGLFSRHNRKYWRHVPYLGLGPSAHSFDGRRRWWNTRSVTDYCRLIGEGTRPVDGHEDLTPEQLLLERLYLGFRTRDGVAREDLGDSDRTKETLLRLTGSGLVTVQGERIIPTRQGYLIADRLPLMF